jgi:RNA polymerase sigma factor (TIGR02999 family)
MAGFSTLLFETAQRGDRAAQDALYRMAFYRLRGIASALLRNERPGHTLQPTALVSELFLKLRRTETRILSEDHFFRVAARAMRQVLIDHARVKNAQKKVPPETIHEFLTMSGCGDVDPELRLAVRTVFDRLGTADPEVAATVWLRSVEGLTLQEISRKQNRSMWRVRADFEFGLHWMSERLSCQARSSDAARPAAQVPGSAGRRFASGL